MEQRRLRLGDIVDDYCPRERRVTNHAVVAMVEEDVKQTRCTTCDAEHAYKGGQAPRRRKKDSTGALYKEVLAGITDVEPRSVLRRLHARSAVTHAAAEPAPASRQLASGCRAGRSGARRSSSPGPAAEPNGREPAAVVEDGPVHRPLIRATLPRIEGHKEEAAGAPDFTIRQSNGRGANFRGNRAAAPARRRRAARSAARGRATVQPAIAGGGGRVRRRHRSAATRAAASGRRRPSRRRLPRRAGASVRWRHAELSGRLAAAASARA